MKTENRLLIVTGLFIIIVLQGLAQGLYTKVNAGYNLAAGTQTLFNYEISETTGVQKLEAVNASFGKGISFSAAFGALISKNFGAELGIGYLLGGNIETSHDMNTYYTESKTTLTQKCTMLYFTPSLLVESGFEKINPYARLGVIIGMPEITATNEGVVTSFLSSTTTKTVYVTETKMDLGIGANAALGVMFSLSEHFSIFGECNINSLSVTPKSTVVTESTIDGLDQLNSMTTSEKETVYETSITDDPMNPTPESEPTKSLKMKMPFSSAGIMLGLRIGF